jgi:hypothetical protein
MAPAPFAEDRCRALRAAWRPVNGARQDRDELRQAENAPDPKLNVLPGGPMPDRPSGQPAHVVHCSARSAIDGTHRPRIARDATMVVVQRIAAILLPQASVQRAFVTMKSAARLPPAMPAAA